MAMECTLKSEMSLSQSKKFSIIDDEGIPILTASQDPITEGLDSFLNDFTYVPFTISFKDALGEVYFSLHKKRSTPFSSTNFVIIFSGGRVKIQEGKRFEMPNLTMNYMGRQIDLVGRVMDQIFSIQEEKKNLASFTGKRIEKGKEYKIEIFDESLPLELYFAWAMIIDNLYYDY